MNTDDSIAGTQVVAEVNTITSYLFSPILILVMAKFSFLFDTKPQCGIWINWYHQSHHASWLLEFPMANKEFIYFRKKLNKTQKQMAQLLSTSLKANQKGEIVSQDEGKNERLEGLAQQIKEKEAIINGISDTLMLLDVETYKILEANQSLLDTYGLSRNQVVGKTCHEITHHLDRAISNIKDQ